MTLLYANNAVSTLAAALGAGDLSLTVAAGDGALFPAPDSGLGEYFMCTLVDAANEPEIVKAAARTGDTLTIERAQEGTSAREFAAGDRVELRLTAGGLDSFIQTGRLDTVSGGEVKGVRYVAASSSISDHGDETVEGSLAWSIAQAGGGPAAIELPGGHTYSLETDLAVPATVRLRFQPGAVIDIGLGVTLTLNCRIEAGRKQIISGDGDVAGDPLNMVLPQWFGAVADGVNDDTRALQKTFIFTRVRFPVGLYCITEPVPLIAGTHVEGEKPYSGYIDWSHDFQQAEPTYKDIAAVLQYLPSNHGALFSAADKTSFMNMVFRSGQVRTDQDDFFSAQADHVTLINCRFENLEHVVSDPSHAQTFGALKVQGCGFFNCGKPFRGVLTDSVFQSCIFTSNDTPFHLTTGAGFNIFDGNRFEWNTRAIMGYQCRANVVSNNLFDAQDETAIYLFNSTNWNISGNQFYRNGRDGSTVGKRSHIHLKGTSLSGVRISNNTFLKGQADGDSIPLWPLHILEIEGAASTYTTFTDNDSINGCVDLPVLDTYYSSPDALLADAVHVKGICNPDGATDALQMVCRNLAKAAAMPVEVHLYENRRWPAYLDIEPGKIVLVGHGNVTLTNDSGASNSILAMHNLTYGRTYGPEPRASAAENAPNAGYWEQGALVWNTEPAEGDAVGWVCVEAGEPGQWRAFGQARGTGTAAPDSGTWARGDMVWNASPDVGEPAGWVCVSAGEPGTWSAFGLVHDTASTYPVSGTWNKGAIVWNTDPDNAEYVGWVCIASGAPGTWKGFGEIPVATPGIPTAGTWKKGDIVWNSDPDPGEYIGWVCTTAGTPGTWKGFGAIQA